MNNAEKGILMLTCRLGDQETVTLTPKQFHGLRRRMSVLTGSSEDQELTAAHLEAFGLPSVTAQRILALLDREEQLERYLDAASRLGIRVITRLDPVFPSVLEQKLGSSAPPALFVKGDLSLLSGPWVSLVGSRRLGRQGRMVAERIGSLAFREGYVLVSGGAPGADTTAQEACCGRGGRALVFTPDQLSAQNPSERVLCCSEDGFDIGFSAARALARNRLIHALGEKTFVAQCEETHGGTWRGSVENLHNGYSPLYLMRDGSAGAEGLLRLGATELHDLESIRGLSDGQLSFK